MEEWTVFDFVALTAAAMAIMAHFAGLVLGFYKFQTSQAATIELVRGLKSSMANNAREAEAQLREVSYQVEKIQTETTSLTKISSDMLDAMREADKTNQDIRYSIDAMNTTTSALKDWLMISSRKS